MNDVLEKPNSIFAIELPAPQQDEISSVIYFVLLLAVGFGAIYWLWLRYGSAKGRAVRQINLLSSKLSSKLSNQPVDASIVSQQLAYEISRIFRSALQLPRLTATTPFPAKLQNHQNRWHSFIDTLDRARYASLALELKELQRLLSDAKFFVKRWR